MEKRVNAVIVSGGAVFAEAGVVLLCARIKIQYGEKKRTFSLSLALLFSLSLAMGSDHREGDSTSLDCGPFPFSRSR